jgi:hypothetical protein
MYEDTLIPNFIEVLNNAVWLLHTTLDYASFDYHVISL